MDSQEDPNLVRIRDRNTVAHLEEAEEHLLRSLQSMPNSVASIFNPIDVPDIESALRQIRNVLTGKRG